MIYYWIYLTFLLNFYRKIIPKPNLLKGSKFYLIHLNLLQSTSDLASSISTGFDFD